MIWRPFTQEKLANPAIKIIKGEGSYLFDENGTRYLDMISSWWVNLHGHANKEIAEEIFKQAKTLEHVIFADFTHAPAENLVNGLSKLLPLKLNRFFFSDDGSTSVEIALKMSYQFFKNQGIAGRNTFLYLENGYHGDTVGAMSVAGKQSAYHSTFSDLFFNTISVPVPQYNNDIQNIEEIEAKAYKKFCEIVEANSDSICSIIIEPLVQGAAGMCMYRSVYLNKICQKAKEHGIFVIFDEVFTGFYRTGTMFAFEQTDVIPDFICLSKGLTGGFLPLALTITSDQVYEAFYSEDIKKTFAHGHSYTANPIACAAACKSLEIILRERTIKSIREIEKVEGLRLSQLTNVTNKRHLGTISAFDLPNEKAAKEICAKLMSNGIFIRPLGKSIYFLPPYCTTLDDINMCFDVVESCL